MLARSSRTRHASMTARCFRTSMSDMSPSAKVGAASTWRPDSLEGQRNEGIGVTIPEWEGGRQALLPMSRHDLL